jgi:uncharacterized protein with HEPN domain
MSQRTADLYLVDVIDAADAIARSVRGLSSDEFVDQPEKRDSVLWNLMIIGEAMTRLSADMEQEMPEVPWEQIRGFRNRIVHGYFALKWPIVWHIATVEIPPLRESAEALLVRNHPETHRRWKERIIAGQADEAL